jgi:FtsZ-binding cell division protein ZapB
MLRLADLQKKIDETAEEMRHLTQDDQDRRPQHKELRQESPFNKDEWYDNFHQVILLSMMLLLWQQNCRILHGHNPTSHLSYPYMMGI